MVKIYWGFAEDLLFILIQSSTGIEVGIVAVSRNLIIFNLLKGQVPRPLGR